jgi:hypothetical protein
MKKNAGFIALISSIIISAILLVIITGLNLNEFYTRSNILDSELKEKSVALAEACADTAILRMVNGSSYSTPSTVNIGSDTCKILSVIGSTIQVQAIYNKNYYTTLQIVLDSSTFAVTSWKEI